MRSQWCREHIDEAAKECGLDEKTVSEVKQAAKFCASHSDFSDCSTRAIIALIRVKDENVREKALSSAQKSLESGKLPVTGKFLKNHRLTEAEIKKIIDQALKEVRLEYTEDYKKEGKKPFTQPPKDHPNHDKFTPQPGSMPVSSAPPQEPLSEVVKKREGSELLVTQTIEVVPPPLPENTSIEEELKHDKAPAHGFVTGNHIEPHGMHLHEQPPLVIMHEKKTDAEADALITTAVKGNWTPKEQAALATVMVQMKAEGKIENKSVNETFRTLIWTAEERMQ